MVSLFIILYKFSCTRNLIKHIYIYIYIYIYICSFNVYTYTCMWVFIFIGYIFILHNIIIYICVCVCVWINTSVCDNAQKSINICKEVKCGFYLFRSISWHNFMHNVVIKFINKQTHSYKPHTHIIYIYKWNGNVYNIKKIQYSPAAWRR